MEGVIRRCYDVRGHEDWHELSSLCYDEKVAYFHVYVLRQSSERYGSTGGRE